jgi:hypothetical protein
MTVLLGVMGNPARAGTLTISVDLGGTVVYSTTGAVDTVALNTDLRTAGSAYRFATNGLSASTQTIGSDMVSLTTTGSITIAAIGSTTPSLSVDVVQTGVLAPIGSNGTLVTSASGTYAGVASGTTTFTGDYQATTASPIVGTASGGTTSFSGSTPLLSIGAVPSGYSLSNSFVISLSKSVNGTEGFSGGVIVTAIPEPSSVVMFTMGMPLAIVFGLIRRRRRRAVA